MHNYRIESLTTGRTFKDVFTGEGFLLLDPTHSDEAFIRTVYPKKSKIHLNREDFSRYEEFLPTNRPLAKSSRSATYHAIELGDALGLSNLFITVSGYVPDRSSAYITGSFKECEAMSVLARMPDSMKTQTLVVASAGNTARAFAYASELYKQPTIIVIPERNSSALWSPHKNTQFTRVLHIQGGDYFDAIRAATVICSLEGFFPEGGAKNIARRDGMGTTMHEAISYIGAIPQHYFQAVGSGTGAIAAFEAVERRIARDMQDSDKRCTLHLSQNSPFTLLVDSWATRKRNLIQYSDSLERKHSAEILAPVLANRKPVYSITGGVFDVLQKTNGHMYAINNTEAVTAKKLFEQTEGYDIDPAAAVAFASLKQAISQKTIQASDTCMVNITGAGYRIAHDAYDIHEIPPHWVLPVEKIERHILETMLSE